MTEIWTPHDGVEGALSTVQSRFDMASRGGNLHLDMSGHSTSDASTASDFEDFGFGAQYAGAGTAQGGGTTGQTYAQDYDIDYLRKKNMELKQELREVQDEYDRQGRLLGTTYRKAELVYQYLPAFKYTPMWHFSPRGLEFTQIYFWILRDALWISQKGDTAMAISAVCIAFAGLAWLRTAISHVWTLTNSTEFFNSLSRLMWVIGLYLWMRSSVYDLEGNERGDIYTPSGTPGRFQATIILCVAGAIQFGTCFARFSNWRVVLVPDQSIPVTQAVYMKPFEEPRLRARFYYLFSSFRDWEITYTFLFISKDIAASQQMGGWWAFFFVLLYFVTVFLLNVSLNTRRVLVDHLHFAALATWLLGIFIFQLSHMFLNQMKTNPWEYMYPRHKSSEHVGNYMAFIFVLLAFVPVGLLYVVWIPATLLGRIREDPDELVAWDVQHADLVSAKCLLGRLWGRGNGKRPT